MDDIKTTTTPGAVSGTTNGKSDKVAAAKAKASEMLDRGKEKGGHALEVLRDFIKTRPAAALGIAAGAGLILGRLIKGRRKARHEG